MTSTFQEKCVTSLTEALRMLPEENIRKLYEFAILDKRKLMLGPEVDKDWVDFDSGAP